MNLYLANANSDWGNVFREEQIKASSWGVAFRRAGGLAAKRVRRRPRHLSVSLQFVGSESKIKENAPQDDLKS